MGNDCSACGDCKKTEKQTEFMTGDEKQNNNNNSNEFYKNQIN